MSLSLDQGMFLVSLARRTLESHVLGSSAPEVGTPDGLDEKRGVFVTLKLKKGGEETLRGCIGFPYPVLPLCEAVREATVAAASQDPRFPPVSKEELPLVIVEVSVLTTPTQLRPERRISLPSMVEVGKDGLIVSNGRTSGLLLPQVAVEYGMKADEFLSEACMKAGLTPDAWLDGEVTVSKFQADVFAEREPGGEVERVQL
jgi:uncharacterized protein (TIGR00296 family)